MTVPGRAKAQDQQEVGVSDELDTVTDAGLDPARRAENDTNRVIVPVPFGSPQLGAGLALAAAWFYQPESSARPWASGIGALYTSNGSWGVGAVQKMSVRDDRLRFDLLSGYGDINKRYYPSEGSSGIDEAWVEVSERTFVASGTARLRVDDVFFVGGRGRFLVKNSHVRDESDPAPEFDQSEYENDFTLLEFGPLVTYDNTQDAFAPREGTILNAQWNLAFPVKGDDSNYNKLQIYGRHYVPVNGRSVAAFQVKTCVSSKDTPFFDLCPISLRGYPSGRFRDPSSWAAEAEWRQPLSSKFGAVAFAGMGSTGDNFGDALGGRLLPAAGIGLRYLVAESYGINLRVDAAVGRDSNALYVSIGEAF